MGLSLKHRWRSEGGYRQVLIIAFPLILSTGAWSIQHFVDRMFLSWYSPEAIAAAMPAGILNFTIMSFFIGTASYASTFVAQYYGADRKHRIGPATWQGVYVSLMGGFVLLCIIPFSENIFRWVGHDPAVRQLETEYFQILCLGGFPVIASSALSGFFSGRGRPWPVMWVNTLSTALNLVLDYALIFGRWGFPEMGMRGACIATVIAAVFSFLLLLGLISPRNHRRTYHTFTGWKPEKDLLARLLRFGIPSGVQFFLEMAGFTAFILLVGRLGTTPLAATNIAFNISTIAFMPMIGSGIAISVLVGQYIGMEKPDLAQFSVYSGFHMASFYMLAVAAAYVVFPDLFVAPFAARANPESFAEIYALTVILLRFVAVYSIFDTMNLIFASAIKGAGDTRFVMFMLMVLSAVVLIIPTYLTIVVFQTGLMMPWVVATLYVISLGLAFYFRFLGGKWKTMSVIGRASSISS
ncbi:MAG: MATE family efflux transporter [Deltaproteobacteria bacterium]|nr:MATE family efflux transporter [Deltaproteobacteria bacterium]